MINTNLFFTIFNLAHKSAILDKIMVFGAADLIYIVIFIILILAFFNKFKSRKSLLLLIISFGIAFILMKITEHFYYHPRPFIAFNIRPLITHAPDTSFPSGHTTLISVIFFSFWYYQSRLWPYFLISLLWIGLARIFVGVHFPFDILGGIVYGFVSTWLGWQIKNWLKKHYF